MRLIDDRAPGYRKLCVLLYAHTGRAYILGITGSPGSGKSSLVDALVVHFRGENRKVGVVAIDPSSPFSGGAILGDRIRMQRHFLDEGVFIRSVATRGALGGLSHSVMDVTRVLDAYGSDVIIVETVGVGQDELDIAGLAHTTVVVTSPGQGDDIQAVKAGILEIADVFVVNKADRPGVESAVANLEHMMGLGREARGVLLHGHAADVHHPDARAASAEPAPLWTPPVIQTVATKNEGIKELAAAFTRHRKFLSDTETGRARQALRLERECLSIFREAVLMHAEKKLGHTLGDALLRVRSNQEDPYTAAEGLVQMATGDKL
ncbi:MAG: methylmalonyl Co-A mutase-associated GTPase MeaB [Myxococcales bacterium]|nr:methylmalonyl Co-A mutase-associated GTPase MeaB [Myxococcales bacterium]